MKSAKILISAILLACTTALSAADFVRDGNNVVININQSENGAKLLRLQVVNDNIIRVEATAEKQFPVKSSLIIIPQTSKPQYTVNDHGAIVEVNAKNVKACVDKQTGRITFYDKSGKVLLKEANNGKSFTRYTVPEENIGIGTLTDAQKNGWSWRALFESPADEAFYGLGQHQSEEFNYKGKNEELFQYNTKVSVPFIMSNKNYGILWDSYSLCRFGNPDDYLQLNRAFTLYDKNGNKGGLTGTYTPVIGQNVVRTEDSLYLENSAVIGNLPKNIRLDGANVTYEGYLEAPQSYVYRFILYYAGYVKVYINGKLVVPERWRTAWNPNAWKFTCQLEKGAKTPIRIEWKPDGGTSYIGLRSAVPQSDEEQNRLSVWSEMTPDMDYYFISGKNMDNVISGYRTLTGKAPIMPKWVMGFWQSREKYKTQYEVVNTLKEFRKRNIPIDNIVQDWDYWPADAWGSHIFSADRYPNPQAMLDSVHAMHGRFMISVWPKFYITTKNYTELDSHGWMYHQAVKDSIKDWVFPGYVGSFYDAYADGVRKMFWRQMDENL